MMLGAAGHDLTDDVLARLDVMTAHEASRMISSKSFNSLRMERIVRGMEEDSEPFDEAHEARRREYAKSGGKGPRPDARRPEREANGIRREDELVFLHVGAGPVAYKVGQICDHHPGVSLGEAWRRLAPMRGLEFDSRDALNAAIRAAMA